MEREFKYVIVGGGVAAGYAALEFSRRGISHGELCIISEESVAPYERPALSKGFLLPEAPARLPSFHTCVGENDERLTPDWYKEHGIELVLGTRVTSVDVERKVLSTSAGETISYKFLIIATGAQAIELEDILVSGANAENVCYLRNIEDATKLVELMKSCNGGKAVVIGGGFIGMECAASLVINKLNVTMVISGEHLMTRLFTEKIASLYEDYYKSQGVKFVKRTVILSVEKNSFGKVSTVVLKDGTRLPADIVVVGIGTKTNTSLFEGQLAMEKGGIKVNGRMQTSNTSVYAVGDVATFPVKLYGDTRGLEHVDFARKSAKQAVAAIMAPEKIEDIDYLPFIYSRVFKLSWQFYGDNKGEVVHYGDFSSGKFGAYWVSEGHLVGSFLEGGTREEFEAIAKATRLSPAIEDLAVLERQGLDFAISVSQQQQLTVPPPTVVWYIIAGVVLATSVVGMGYWLGRRKW